MFTSKADVKRSLKSGEIDKAQAEQARAIIEAGGACSLVDGAIVAAAQDTGESGESTEAGGGESESGGELAAELSAKRARFALARPRFVRGLTDDRWTWNQPSTPIVVGTDESGAIIIERAADPVELGGAVDRDGEIPPVPTEFAVPAELRRDGGGARLTIARIGAVELVAILNAVNVKAVTSAQAAKRAAREAARSMKAIRAEYEPSLTPAFRAIVDDSPMAIANRQVWWDTTGGAQAVAIRAAELAAAAGLVPSSRFAQLIEAAAARAAGGKLAAELAAAVDEAVAIIRGAAAGESTESTSETEAAAAGE